MNSKQKMDLQYSFHHMYDRIGEGVYFNYIVEYDWEDILKNNFNKDNFKIIPGGIPSEYNSYFSQYSINKSKWEKNMVEYLLSSRNDMTYEDFLENLNSEQIEAYDNKW